jgi:hypothetical protein
VSSRLVRAASGKPVAVEVTVPSAGLEHGVVFRVLGNELRRPSGIGWTGETAARPPTPEEAGDAVRRGATGPVERAARKWTDEHRAAARRLHAESSLSWSQIAEEVCGDKRYKPTVGTWLRPGAVAGNGSVTAAPGRGEPD